MIGGGSGPPPYKRVMIFVDGTNLLEELGTRLGMELSAFHPPDSAITYARQLIDCVARHSGTILRRYWFGSFSKNDGTEDRLLTALHRDVFEPHLLRQTERKEKGVDLALAVELLTNAFHRNFDIGWIVSGDADYAGVVKAAKRYGAVMNGMFFTGASLSPKLKLAVDEFWPLDQYEHHEFTRESKAELVADLTQLQAEKAAGSAGKVTGNS